MGLLDWFKRNASKDVSVSTAAPAAPLEALTFGEGEGHLGSLDMKAALDAHAAWKQRLQDVMDGKQAPPEVHQVARDDLCALGQWLHGEGRAKFGGSDEYRTLLKTHAEFHLCVGDALSAHLDGRGEDAEDCKKKMRGMSDRVQLALVRLFMRARGLG
ncbi:CZB domain-containing protein [Thermomonas flagellata]|uniref:CZB domain-containing protein n=1 Tax=Thermomonas flagellata TaxID=2888524 RepID=UPI001F03AD18|nr:CZB domain-containing protein [Thermomonas flagellata]